MDILSDLGERLKPQSHYRDEAIRLALEGNWEEAVATNQLIVERFGGDEETWNRLGKAHSELGHLKEALSAYESTLKIAPLNTIAQKNQARLSSLLAERGQLAGAAEKVDPALFIEEIGKTTTTLLEGTEPEVAAKVAPGDVVTLAPSGDSLEARSARKVYLGFVESKLARRLLKFIAGGNRYDAAVASVEGDRIRLFIREIHQDPRFAGQPSFPTRKPAAASRTYAREALIAPEYDVAPFTVEEEDEDEDEGEEPIEELEGMHAVEPEEEEEELIEFDEEDDNDSEGDGY